MDEDKDANEEEETNKEGCGEAGREREIEIGRAADNEGERGRLMLDAEITVDDDSLRRVVHQ